MIFCNLFNGDDDGNDGNDKLKFLSFLNYISIDQHIKNSNCFKIQRSLFIYFI